MAEKIGNTKNMCVVKYVHDSVGIDPAKPPPVSQMVYLSSWWKFSYIST